jgi:hypothetical protein
MGVCVRVCFSRFRCKFCRVYVLSVEPLVWRLGRHHHRSNGGQGHDVPGRRGERERMFLDFLCQLNTPNRHGRSLKREQKKPKATEGGVDVPQPEVFAEMDRLLTVRLSVKRGPSSSGNAGLSQRFPALFSLRFCLLSRSKRHGHLLSGGVQARRLFAPGAERTISEPPVRGGSA